MHSKIPHFFCIFCTLLFEFAAMSNCAETPTKPDGQYPNDKEDLIYPNVNKIEIPKQCPEGVSQDLWNNSDDSKKRLILFAVMQANQIKTEETGAKMKNTSASEPKGNTDKRFTTPAEDRAAYFADPKRKEKGYFEADIKLMRALLQKDKELKKQYPNGGPEYEKELKKARKVYEQKHDRLDEVGPERFAKEDEEKGSAGKGR